MTMQLEDGRMKRFFETISKFPNFFDLHETKNILQKRWSNVKEQLIGELPNVLSEREKLRDLNLLTFTCLMLMSDEHLQEAILMNDKAFESVGGDRNINCLVLRAVIALKKGLVHRVKEISRKLNDLKDGVDYAFIEAEANSDLAYIFSRMNSIYYWKSIKIYAALIKLFPDEYSWKMRFCVVLKRCVHVRIAAMHEDLDMDIVFLSGEELLKEIIALSSTYRIRAMAELAELYCYAYKYELKLESYPDEILKGLALENVECLLKENPKCNDEFVLTLCGKCLLTLKKYDRAVEYLERSISARPTTTAYHHLARTLKSILNQELSYETNTEKSNLSFRDTINNPGKDSCVKYPAIHPATQKILLMYQSAVEESKGINTPSLFDLGIFCREIYPPDLDGAIAYFRQCISRTSQSPLEYARAYEQIGLCLMSQSDEDTRKDEERNDLKEEASTMFEEAIRYQAKCLQLRIAELKTPSKFWNSIPCLKELLLSDVYGKKQFAKHYLLLREHRESLSCYEEVKTLLESSSETDPEVYEGFIENYLAMGEINKLYSFLQVLTCSEDGLVFAEEKRTFLLKVYLKMTEIAISSERYENISHFLSEAFRYWKKGNKNENKYDAMLVYDDGASCSEAMCLLTWLTQYCDLSVTHSNNITLGTPRITGCLDLMSESHVVLFVFKDDCDLSFYVDTVIALKKTVVNILAPGTTDDVLPKIFKTKPTKTCLNQGTPKDEVYKWLYDLFNLFMANDL